jgi:hypothetical protein
MKSINRLVCFFLGNSPASEFYMPMFRNTLSVPFSYLPAYENGTECFETSAYKIQTPGNYPEESIQHPEHGESLKSKINRLRRQNAEFHTACLQTLTRVSETQKSSENPKFLTHATQDAGVRRRLCLGCPTGQTCSLLFAGMYVYCYFVTLG